MYLCVYVSVCVLACVLSLPACAYVCGCATRTIYVWSSKCVCEHIEVRACVYACVNVRVCVCVHACKCVHMCARVCIAVCVGIESVLVLLHAVCRCPLFLSFLHPESFSCVCFARAYKSHTHIPHGLDASQMMDSRQLLHLPLYVYMKKMTWRT
jgi:hypothetical protein